jgi:hypothetical protein
VWVPGRLRRGEIFNGETRRINLVFSPPRDPVQRERYGTSYLYLPGTRPYARRLEGPCQFRSGEREKSKKAAHIPSPCTAEEVTVAWSIATSQACSLQVCGTRTLDSPHLSALCGTNYTAPSRGPSRSRTSPDSLPSSQDFAGSPTLKRKQTPCRYSIYCT